MTEAEVTKLLNTPEAQEHLGSNWSVIRKIGNGAFGSVYEIQKTDFGTISTAALKVVAVPSEETRNSYRMSMSEKDYRDYCESLKASLSDEHDKLKSLEGNAHVVAYQGHCFVEDGDGWAMLLKMELLEDIQHNVKASGITRQEVIKLGIHICKALELCHNTEHKLLHRDIKPDNIFVSKYGDYKLGDFGVSKNMAATLSIMSKQGNAMYMAPEVYKNQGTYGYTVDLYSLGLVMYHYMNNNRPPFGGSGKFTKDLHAESLERRMSGERLPYPENEDGALAKIVLKACSYRPDDRYETAADMRAALEALVDITDPKVYLEAGGVPPVASIRVRFLKDNNTPISEEVYFKGEKISIPQVTKVAERDGYRYTFTGWTPEIKAIASADMDYYPTYKKEKIVCVRFLNDGQQVISAKHYIKGEQVQIPPEPSRTANNGIKYIFNGWTPAVQKIADEDADYTATYQLVAAENSKKWLFLGGSIVIAALCLLLCVVLLVANRGNNAVINGNPDMDVNSNNGVVETPGVKKYTQAEMKQLLDQADWSDWTDELPEEISTKDYVIQSQFMYSSAPAVFFHADKRPSTGYDVCYTYSSYPEEFSPWQKEKVEATDTRIVETRPIYYYKQGRTTTYVNSKRVTVTSLVWSKNWTLSDNGGTEPITETKTRQVKIEYEYCYKDLTEYVCCSESNSWSDWSEVKVQPTEDKNVRIKLMYRYTQKPEGIVAASMENFVQRDNSYSGQFMDVKDSKWYGSENSTCIRHTVELGALVPTEYLCFRPEEDLTIGEAIRAMVTLHRIYNDELGILPEAEEWYVDYGVERGLIKAGAYNNRLNETASRKEVAYLLCNALPKNELEPLNTVKKITDMSTNSEYYDAVYQLARAGVISWPKEEYAYEPDRSMTRAEAASLVERLAFPEKRYIAK